MESSKMRYWSLIATATFAICSNFLYSYFANGLGMQFVNVFQDGQEKSSILAKANLFLDNQPATPLADHLADLSYLLFIFFNTSFGLVIFCLFDRNFVTTMLHGVLHAAVFGCLVQRLFLVIHGGYNFPTVFQIPACLLLSLYGAELVIGLCKLACRSYLSREQMARLCKQHAFLGVVIFSVLLWNVLLHLSVICANSAILKRSAVSSQDGYYWFLVLQPGVLVAVVYLYVLLVMTLLLMPTWELRAARKRFFCKIL